MIESFLKRVESLGFTVKTQDKGNFHIGLECCPQWNFYLINFDCDKFIPFFYYRQKRMEEVTDLHEIIPITLAAISKSFGNSSFRFLGQCNEFSGIDDELYGMYWFPAQPLNEKIRKNYEQDFEALFDILMDLYMFHLQQGDILGVSDIGHEDFFYDSPELNIWVGKIKQYVGCNESFVANGRCNPDWFYFRSVSSEVSIIKSPHIAGVLKEFSKVNNDRTIIDGVLSKVDVYEKIKTTISFAHLAFARGLLSKLDDDSEMELISQENQLIFVSDYHIVVKYCHCGVESFLDEKELIRERQSKEISLLFGDRNFIWNIVDRKSSADFEDLILELLSREPWVFSVKKVAPTNQGDNGRDLICEYDMFHGRQRIRRGAESFKKGKMIVQCKTNLKDSKKSSIGKPDVEVANTIFDYRPDGYMLVVNTQLTRDLTEMLERQKDRGEQDTILWWNAFDIEERLRKNPDILARYRHLVGYE